MTIEKLNESHLNTYGMTLETSDPTHLEDWADIKAWRKAKREQLIASRLSMPKSSKKRSEAIIVEKVANLLKGLAPGCIGFYWPFKGEIDLRQLMRNGLPDGFTRALPVVVEKAKPLEFWKWQPGQPLRAGVWRIPIPDRRIPMNPSVLLVPLVGFCQRGYRLGYGGGYYDRTLATMNPRPVTIAVGFDQTRLETIFPQSHDIPMDVIVTRSDVRIYRDSPE